MKLHYFVTAGRGSAIRLLLKIGKIDFVDERHSFEEWPDFKAKCPLGQMPVLELDDGTMIPQTLAILEYAANKAGWVHSDPLLAARVTSIVQGLEDLVKIFATWMHSSEEHKESTKHKCKDDFTIALKNLDKYVARTEKDGYAVGTDKAVDTLADLRIADLVHMPPPPFTMPFDIHELIKSEAPTLVKIAGRFKNSHAAEWSSMQPPYLE